LPKGKAVASHRAVRGLMSNKKAKSPSFETKLAEIGAALRDAQSPENRERLRAALLQSPAMLAARVAKSIGERRLLGFDDVLEQVFRRFQEHGVKDDPGCRAKQAALDALDLLESRNDATFLAATNVVQMEPAYGGPVDTAVGIRARGVVALARIGFSDLPLVAARLLADSESPVRRAAADAIAYYGERSVAALAYLKLQMGDADELVTLACASALLSLAPEWGLRAVRPLLFEQSESMRELIAIALGEARHEGAVEMLFEYLDVSVVPAERAVVLRGLALNRSERVRTFLLARIREAGAVEARAAVAALGAHAHEPGLGEKVASAAQKNTRVDLRRDVAAAFPDVQPSDS